MLELLSTAEMARADALSLAAGHSGLALMQAAGEAVAQACERWRRTTGRNTVAVVCGPGNNGGDGFIAAQVLKDSGWDVRVFLWGEVAALKGDASHAAAQWSGPVQATAALDLRDVDLVVDALLGAGLSRDLEGEALRIVHAINAASCPVLAVDVPSGIDGTTGLERGASVRAGATVTFFRAKPGHYLHPAAGRRGLLTVADIGIPADVLDEIRPTSFLNAPPLWLPHYPWPKSDGHKYNRGHAVVVSGGPSHTGAARMSARGALRVGAGLVTLASPSDAAAVNAGHLTAIMLRVSDGPKGLADVLSDPRKNAVVLGPGLGVGPETTDLVGVALAPANHKGAPPRACVLDADALTSFAGRAKALAGLIAGASGSVVITPHDGEFARLFANEPGVTEAGSKLDKARAAAGLLGCTVVLKGPDTVVASPAGRCSIAAGDAPWLATAGSGDVLSGFVCGLLAQGLAAFDAASAAVWLHAAGAKRFGPGLIAEDLPELLPAVLRELYEGETSNQQRKPATA